MGGEGFNSFIKKYEMQYLYSRQSVLPYIIGSSIIIYENGDAKTALTSGYTKQEIVSSSTSTMTLGASDLLVSCVGSASTSVGIMCLARTTNMIDITNMKTLNATIYVESKVSNSSNDGGNISLGIVTSTAIQSNNYVTVEAQYDRSAAITPGTVMSISCDISTFNGSHYIFARAAGGQYCDVRFRISKIWLE